MNKIESQIMFGLATAPGPGRVKWRGGWTSDEIHEFIGGDKQPVLDAIRSLCKCALIRGLIVDGLDDSDLKSWRFVLTKKGAREVNRVRG